ncbi:hypothetical protein ACFV2Q_03955 [Streptomyces sp. NPDC059650]|uniref:hypothetical protein n=1 Tax=Streptomyces sp. NPDC059650 TaxID=3346896 RepID=UPI0036C88E75
MITTVCTGGSGGAVSGAGKAGAVARALSFAGKAGKVIDPITYIFKGAGAGISKIGDVMNTLRGMGKIEAPQINIDGALALPDGAKMLPDGTIRLPSGAAVPDGAVKLPDGSIKLPEGTTTFPEGTIKLPKAGAAQFMDPEGNLYDAKGNITQHANEASTDIVDTPKAGAPKADTQATVKTPDRVLTGVGARADNAIRLGSDISDPVHAADHAPTGHADTTPGGNAHDFGKDPSASHDAPAGSGRTEGPGGSSSETTSGGYSGDADASPAHSGDGTGRFGNGGNHSGAGAGSDGVGSDSHPPANRPDGASESPNGPTPALTPEEQAAHARHLEDIEQRHTDDFDELKQDPDHKGKVKPSEMDEARLALDMREQGKLPADIQRPPGANQGDLYSPGSGEFYDIKGVHSDWPPLNNVRDKSMPFKGAYNPADNQGWVRKLKDQIEVRRRIVILDMRNANQAAIDDLEAIVKQNGWSDRIVWYP